eukprot:gene5866-11846_t
MSCLCLCECCKRGGCCRQAPRKIIHDPDGKVLRINLLYNHVGCCFRSEAGIDDDIPNELLQNGLTQFDVQEWIYEKLKACSATRAPCFLTCICLPVRCCGGLRREILESDAMLRQWQKDFNSSVLMHKGMFVKTQSRCDVTYDKNGKHRHIERWISFAMTPEEIEILKNEPHLIGDIEHGCCGLPPEEDLCLHP